MQTTGKMSLVLISVLLLAGVGCNRKPPTAEPKPPEVLVASPVQKPVTEFEEFTGRTEAVRSVEVRARVTGYLDRVNFKEGADVKEGDLLFEIDPRTYSADVDRAAANLGVAEAHFNRLSADYKRAQAMVKRSAMSEEEFERVAGDRLEAEASVRASRAQLDLAKLNLSFTKLTAPLSGRISRQMVDPGNLVKADETMLTTIITSDPMYAYFDVDERTLLRLRRMVREGRIQSAREAALPVELGLTDEEGFSMNGTIDFVDNRLVTNTGTLRVRGLFANPKRILSPGLFVRIRMPVGQPRPAIMVPEQSLGTDQGQKFIYVVDDKNVVQYRRVKVGPQQENLRAIEQGVAMGDRVIVSGLQRVRPGLTVDPKMAEKPSPGTTDNVKEAAKS
ncbi:MAG: efflux RND transporter periplasmic adaptor subunit [Gemmataceae bacterium]